MPGIEPNLSTSDVAEICHVSRVTVWKWIKRGQLYASRDAAGNYVIARDTLQRFAEERGYVVDPELFRRPKRVLVVDDEPPVVEVVTRALAGIEADIVVATASDGFEAGLQTATFRPDLLILDLMMPHMDGFHVCQLVRHDPTTAHTKILIITAYGSQDNIERAMRAGADAFLHKPIDIHVLRSRVRDLISLDH